MQKVITINLQGVSYQVEEEGYNALTSYLADAKATLAGNPDAEEIAADLEQAIAEKCAAYITRSKNVILSNEIKKILAEMGPVKNEMHADAERGKTEKENGAVKRLYRIREGAVLSGVANGLAAYFNVDVTLMRVLFVLAAILTQGAAIIAYIAMVLLVPAADTPEERAAARGTPLTAEGIMNRAREEFDHLKDKKEWKKWKYEMKQNWREERRRHAETAWQWRAYQPSPFWQFMHEVMGLVWFAFLIWISWYGYNHVALVHEFFDQIGVWLREGAAWLQTRFG